MSQKAETPSIRHSRADIWSFVIFFGFVIVIVFLIYPLFDIFRYSFMDKKTQTFSLSNWKTFFSKVYYLRAFWHSIVIAILTTFFSMVLGIPLAFFTTRYRIKGANLLNTLSVLALLSPTFIGAYSWITMLGRNGFLRLLFQSIGINLPPIYGPLGIVLADTLQYYPFISLMTAGALMTIDRSRRSHDHRSLARRGFRKPRSSFDKDIFQRDTASGSAIGDRWSPHCIHDVAFQFRNTDDNRRELPCAADACLQSLYERNQPNSRNGFNRIDYSDALCVGCDRAAAVGLFEAQIC